MIIKNHVGRLAAAPDALSRVWVASLYKKPQPMSCSRVY